MLGQVDSEWQNLCGDDLIELFMDKATAFDDSNF
jgi:hypothetical protein